MEILNLFLAPAFTAGFFLIDLAKTGGLYYNWHRPIFKNTLLAYILNFFLIGLGFYIAYYYGLKIFNKEPSDIVSHFTTKKTPAWLISILQTIAVAWFTHGFCTSRLFPGLGTTLEAFVISNFFRNLKSDLNNDKNRGRLTIARNIIKKYNKKNIHPLSFVMFTTYIGKYVIANKRGAQPKELSLLQGLLRDLESITDLDIAIAFALNDFTPKQVKSILDI